MASLKKAAKRSKAPPKPKPPRSWIAHMWATSGTLCGGVKESRSSRWGVEQDANDYLESSLGINRDAGNKCDGRVIPSNLPPEIFRHCGADPQAIGGRCHRCKKILTGKDAKDFVAVPLKKE
jgi:hypothetical protein